MIARLLQLPDKEEKHQAAQKVKASQEAVVESVDKLHRFLDAKRLDRALIQEFKGLRNE